MHRVTSSRLLCLLLVCGVGTPVLAQTAQDTPNEMGNPTGSMPAGITPPKLIYSVNAEFSEEARHKGIEGETTVAVIIDKDGMPHNVHVTRSAAEGQKPKLQKAAATLDAKAVEAVRQYRFEPAMRDGQPVAVEIHVEVHFHIVH